MTLKKTLNIIGSDHRKIGWHSSEKDFTAFIFNPQPLLPTFPFNM